MPIKRIALASLAVIMALWSVPNPARASYSRVTKTFTVTAGTPVQVVSQQPTVADEVIIQPVAGATVGLVYVMAGVYNHTPSVSSGTDVTAQLCAATSTAPGCTYTDGTLGQPSTGIDVGSIWLDVATTGTKVSVSYQPR